MGWQQGIHQVADVVTLLEIVHLALDFIVVL